MEREEQISHKMLNILLQVLINWCWAVDQLAVAVIDATRRSIAQSAEVSSRSRCQRRAILPRSLFLLVCVCVNRSIYKSISQSIRSHVCVLAQPFCASLAAPCWGLLHFVAFAVFSFLSLLLFALVSAWSDIVNFIIKAFGVFMVVSFLTGPV